LPQLGGNVWHHVRTAAHIPDEMVGGTEPIIFVTQKWVTPSAT